MHRRPDLFHVGHPRSATGHVYRWLAGHPEIFMGRKELHYFGSDVGFNDPPRSFENYVAHFAEAGDARIVGDSSTWYLASERAADEIHAFQRGARIIVSLRDPVDMLRSLHAHLYANGDEDIPELRAALHAEPVRRNGQWIPGGSLPRIALHYRKTCCYAEQLRRYFDRFGRDRVHVVLFDDIKRDPGGTYRALLSFLGVATDYPGFEDVVVGDRRSRNSNWTVRSRHVQGWLKRPINQGVLMGVRPEPVPGWFQVLRVARRLNSVQCPRAPVEPAFLDELRASLRPEVEALEQLLGRDLHAWKLSEPAAAAAQAR